MNVLNGLSICYSANLILQTRNGWRFRIVFTSWKEKINCIFCNFNQMSQRINHPI